MYGKAYVKTGENVRVIFSGGSANNIHLLVDAPKEVNIARSSVGKKKEQPEQSARTYYRKKGISEEAQREIVSILMREKKRNAVNEKP